MRRFVLEKTFEYEGARYALVTGSVDELSSDSSDCKAEVSVTEDAHYFTGRGRSVSERHGFLAKWNGETAFGDLSEESGACSETGNDCMPFLEEAQLELLSDKEIDFVEVLPMQGFLLCSYRQYGSKTLLLGTYRPGEKSLQKIEVSQNYHLKAVCSDGEKRAMLLLENEREQSLLSLDFMKGADLYHLQALASANKSKEHIFDLAFEGDEMTYKLRQAYRTKQIRSSTDRVRREKLFTSPGENYAILYREGMPAFHKKQSFHTTEGMLHIHLRDLSEEAYESYDFLKDTSRAVLKIEGDFSRIFQTVDIELSVNKVLKTVKEYFEEGESYESISVSGLGYASVIALNLIAKLEEDKAFEQMRCSSLILEKFPGDLITYRYTSFVGERIPRMAFQDYFKASALNKLETLKIPFLLIAYEDDEDTWYGQGLTFYGAGKFLNKTCQFLLLKDQSSERASAKREDQIKKWIIEHSL